MASKQTQSKKKTYNSKASENVNEGSKRPTSSKASNPTQAESSKDDQRKAHVMATSGSSRAMSSDESGNVAEKRGVKTKTSSEMIAYVEKVSPPKRNRNDTMDYSNVVFQLEGGVKRRAVCFSRAKRNLLFERKKNQTPVKISAFNVAQDLETVYINDMTHISDAASNECSFQFESLGDEATLRTLAEIMSDSESMDLVNFSARVLQMDEIEITKVKRLRKVECLISDGSCAMKLVVWEGNIAMIEVKKAYTFQQVRFRVENNEKMLNTTIETTITPNEDEELNRVEESGCSSMSIIDSITVPIESIQEAVWIKECSNCHKRIIQNSAGSIIKCDYCNFRVRKEMCNSYLMVNVLVQNGEEKVRLTIFQNVLEKVFGTANMGNEEAVCELLLSLNDVTLTFNKKRKIVSKIEVKSV